MYTRKVCMYARRICISAHEEYVFMYMRNTCKCTWRNRACFHTEDVCVYMMNMFMHFMCRLEGQRKMLNVFLCHSWVHFFQITPSAEPNLRLKSSNPWLSYLHVLNPWCYRSVCCYWLFYLFIVFVGTEDLNWESVDIIANTLTTNFCPQLP